MVSAAKAFSKEPPLEPLTSLKAIKKDFKWRYVDRKKTDQVIEFCRDAPKFATAVRRAVEARDANGKHHNHQSKVDITARRKFGASIVSQKKHIKAIPLSVEFDWLTHFDVLHDTIDSLKPYGIGPVTVYDVAVRLGAFMGIEPKQVYMHAGVRQGLKALEDALHRRWQDPMVESPTMDLIGAHKLPRVPMYLFPKPFRDMRADDVEDILCTYREVFDTW
jgi:hypothetical protein